VWASAEVTSKNKFSSARGKSQSSAGEPKITFVKEAHYAGQEALQVTIGSTHRVGNGFRGGDYKVFDTEALVFLDKATILECINCALSNQLVNADEIFRGKMSSLLAAALQLEKAREAA
jgi:hypothetical protein